MALRCALFSAHLYRKRPLHIVGELDDRFSHEIKGKFYAFLNGYQAVARENESLFLRNVALTKETLEHRTAAEEDRRERERWQREAQQLSERCQGAERELEDLKRRVARQERDDDVRRRKEAARALHIKTELLSRSFVKNGAEAEEKNAGDSAQPTLPSGLGPASPASPRSPGAVFGPVSPSGRSRALQAAADALPALPQPTASRSAVPASPTRGGDVGSPKGAASGDGFSSPSRASTRKKRAAAVATAKGRQSGPGSGGEDGPDSPLTPTARSRSPYATALTVAVANDSAGGGGGTLPSILSPSRRAAMRSAAGGG